MLFGLPWQMEGDLEDMRRKLDMAEGSKSALQSQVDEMRAQLRRLDADSSKMRSHLEEQRVEEELRERRQRRSRMYCYTITQRLYI